MLKRSAIGCCVLTCVSSEVKRCMPSAICEQYNGVLPETSGVLPKTSRELLEDYQRHQEDSRRHLEDCLRSGGLSELLRVE